MDSTKIRPEVGVRTVHREHSLNYEILDEYQIVEKEVDTSEEYYDVRRQLGYCHARSLFLKSYHFSEDKEGWRKKMKKKAKEANLKAKLALVAMGRKAMVRSRKFDVKPLALKMDPMTAAIVKYFVPCSSSYHP